MPNNSLRTWIEISQGALKHNCGVFRRLIGPKCRLMAVVKSNAYGHGLFDFSFAAERFGADWFGVDSIVEAEHLREAGLKKPILVLGLTLKDKIESARKNNISLTIADFPSLENLTAVKKGTPKLKIHLKIDTGMHRQGFFVSEIPAVIKILKKKLPAVEIEGVYTHFASAKNPAFPFETLRQMGEFKKAIALLEAAGFRRLIKHAAATAGTIIFPQSHFDMVRIGIGLYGLWPSKETQAAFEREFQLKSVLSWKTIVGQIKKLPKNSRIGYDLTEAVKRDSRVAILPIGYWHGFPRLLSSVGKVLIKGKEAKVLGRVSMDMISVDITGIKNAKTGDEAVLIGRDVRGEISADDLAFLTDTTSYEIVTRLNPLMKRIMTK